MLRPKPVNFTPRPDGTMSDQSASRQAAFWPGLQIIPVTAKLLDCEELSPACPRHDESWSPADKRSTESWLRRFFLP